MKFFRQTMERAVKTFAQTVLVTWGVAGNAADAHQLNNIFNDGWIWVSGAAGAVLSILTSIASMPVGNDHNSPSAVN
jgi:hypothetical protein